MFNLKIVDLSGFDSWPNFEKRDFRTMVPGKDYDCIITPGNSFGIMDGGFDKVVRDKFPRSQETVQTVIKQFWGKEMPVGQAITVSLSEAVQLCYAPTMRFPSPTKSKDIAYHAALAAFCQIKYFNRISPDRAIKNVVMPLFCTATGGMPVEVSYEQIMYAYQRAISGDNSPEKNWGDLLVHRDNLKRLSSWTNKRTGR